MLLDGRVAGWMLFIVSVRAQSGASVGDTSAFENILRSTTGLASPSLAVTGTDTPQPFTSSAAWMVFSGYSTTIPSAVLATITDPAATPFSTTTATTTPTTTSTPIADATLATSSSFDTHTLTITLAVTLSALALALLVLAFLLTRRYRGRSPFRRSLRRGATPIDDDEIATWRGKAESMTDVPGGHMRKASSIVVKPSQSYWSTPGSSSPADSSARFGEPIPLPPPVVARAPNARSGLTDEAIPGAVPFVATCRRESRRLSKVASAGHMRSKSRKSNASVVSLPEGRPSTSRSPWIEPDDWAVQREPDPTEKMPIPMSSIDDDDEKPRGLAPRPARPPNISLSDLPGSAF